MGLFNKIFGFLLPGLLIPPHLQSIWAAEERTRYLTTIKYGLILFAFGHVAHHFLIDPTLNLEPASRWMLYRYGMAVSAIVVWLISSRLRSPSAWVNKMPFFFWGLITSYLQFQTMNWSDKVPYEFCLGVAFLITIALRSSPLVSVLYFLATFASGWDFIIARPNQFPYIVSATITLAVAVALFRARMSTDVAAFTATQENLMTQKKLVEVQMDLNNQVKAFLPSVIYERFLSLMRNRRTSSLQAMDQVTRLRETQVACVYSDIRGYTKLSKVSLDFVRDVAIPNIKASTEIVESNGGIPRLVGDLVFSYFDWEPKLSILRAIKTGMDLIENNIEMNRKSDSVEIRRYVLISFGKALVGNIGGAENAREITVMGSPANILSRMDPLTKVPRFIECMPQHSLILDSAAMKACSQAGWNLDVVEIDLRALELPIRDFPEENNLYCIPTNSESRKHVLALLEPEESMEFLTTQERKSS